MSSASLPPRFVPTLTEVVDPGSVSFMPVVPVVPVVSRLPDIRLPTASIPSLPDESLRQLEDQLLHRVMQRVDLVLERRLHEAVSHTILTHTQTLGPRLREEIELVVRESVSQAIAQELPLSTSDN